MSQPPLITFIDRFLRLHPRRQLLAEHHLEVPVSRSNVMSYYESSGSSQSFSREDYILISTNASHYAEEPHSIANKWNDFFLNCNGVDIVTNSKSSKSAILSSTSSSCSSTSLDGFNRAERPPNKGYSPQLSPTEKDISLANPERKSDGLCRITLCNKRSTLQNFPNSQDSVQRNDKMERSRLDDETEEIDHYTALPLHGACRLHVEDFDRIERLKISNGECGTLKSVKDTVRGYKNMVRRYSASFNSKGHVIPPSGTQVSLIKAIFR